MSGTGSGPSEAIGVALVAARSAGPLLRRRLRLPPPLVPVTTVHADRESWWANVQYDENKQINKKQLENNIKQRTTLFMWKMEHTFPNRRRFACFLCCLNHGYDHPVFCLNIPNDVSFVFVIVMRHVLFQFDFKCLIRSPVSMFRTDRINHVVFVFPYFRKCSSWYALWLL